MNIFGIVALVAFALCAGSALWEKKRQRAGYEARIKGLNENILSLSDRMHGIEAERDGLREQVAVYLHANTSEIKQSRTHKKPLARTE